MGVLTMVPASRGGSLGSEVGAWKAIELVARRGWRRTGKLEIGARERDSVQHTYCFGIFLYAKPRTYSACERNCPLLLRQMHYSPVLSGLAAFCAAPIQSQARVT